MRREPSDFRVAAAGAFAFALACALGIGAATANERVALKDVCLAGNAAWTLEGIPVSADWGSFCQTIELRRFGGTSCVENDNGTPRNPFDDFWEGGGAYQIFWKGSRFEGKASLADSGATSEFRADTDAATESFPYAASANAERTCNTRLAVDRTGAELEAKGAHALATIRSHDEDFTTVARFRPGAAVPLVPFAASAGEHLCSEGTFLWDAGLTFVEFTFAGTQTELCSGGAALDLSTTGSGSGNVLYPF